MRILNFCFKSIVKILHLSLVSMLLTKKLQNLNSIATQFWQLGAIMINSPPFFLHGIFCCLLEAAKITRLTFKEKLAPMIRVVSSITDRETWNYLRTIQWRNIFGVIESLDWCKLSRSFYLSEGRSGRFIPIELPVITESSHIRLS